MKGLGARGPQRTATKSLSGGRGGAHGASNPFDPTSSPVIPSDPRAASSSLHPNPSAVFLPALPGHFLHPSPLQPVPGAWPRGLPPRTSVPGCPSPARHRPDLPELLEMIRIHLFSGAHDPFLLPASFALVQIRLPRAPLSTHRPYRRSGQDTLPLSCAPHTAFSAAPTLPPGDTPLPLCGCSRPGARILSPAAPPRTSPPPAWPVPLEPRGPSLAPRPPRDPVQPSCRAGPLRSSIPAAARSANGQGARRGARRRGQPPASSPGRRPRLPPAGPGPPGAPHPGPTVQPTHKLTCGSPGGGCGERRRRRLRGGECAPLGGAGRRGARVRSCGRAGNGLSLTQPRAAPAAAAASERLQTCSVPGPAGVDRTKRRGGGGGREDAASPSYGARGPGGRGGGGAAPLKIAPAEARAGARSCTPPHPTPPRAGGPGPERAAGEVPARAPRSRRRNGASSAGTGAGAKSEAAPISGSRHLEKRRTVGVKAMWKLPHRKLTQSLLDAWND